MSQEAIIGLVLVIVLVLAICYKLKINVFSLIFDILTCPFRLLACMFSD